MDGPKDGTEADFLVNSGIETAIRSLSNHVPPQPPITTSRNNATNPKSFNHSWTKRLGKRVEENEQIKKNQTEETEKAALRLKARKLRACLSRSINLVVRSEPPIHLYHVVVRLVQDDMCCISSRVATWLTISWIHCIFSAVRFTPLLMKKTTTIHIAGRPVKQGRSTLVSTGSERGQHERLEIATRIRTGR